MAVAALGEVTNEGIRSTISSLAVVADVLPRFMDTFQVSREIGKASKGLLTFTEGAFFAEETFLKVRGRR